MKFTCHGVDLSEAALRVSKAISSKKTVNYLDGIKLCAKENYLLLTATDNELLIEKKIMADIEIEGEIIAPSKFTEFIKMLSGGEISLSIIEDRKVELIYDKGVTTLNCLDVKDYPETKEIKMETKISIKVKNFKKLVNSVIYAVATNDARPIFNGVLFEAINNELTAVALDGYRLAAYTETDVDINKDISIIIPPRALNEIIKLCDDDEKVLELIIGEGNIMIKFENALIISRLINGEYINYKGIYPSDSSTDIIINIEEFKSAMERASYISKSEKTNLVKFNIEKNEMNILSQSDDMGKGNECLIIEKEGKDMEISFNAKFIIDCLNSIDSKFVKAKFKDSAKAALFIPVDNNQHINLILPIRAAY